MRITKQNYFTFTGGEVHCKWLEQHRSARLTCLDYSMNGFMSLCEHREILARQFINELQPSVVYPYLPYARQDRVMAEDEPFSLKIFCNLLNSQNFSSVTIYDPHSDVGPALINNCIVIPQWEIAKDALPATFFEDRNVLFVSPDAGAYKKVSKLMSDDTRIILGVKNRNIEGKITHTDVFSPTSIAGKDCVIVDDICDGGRTFIELAKVLWARGADRVVLYVTHGIFSNGLDEIKQHIDHVYTTNSFPNEPSDYMTVHKIV